MSIRSGRPPKRGQPGMWCMWCMRFRVLETGEQAVQQFFFDGHFDSSEGGVLVYPGVAVYTKEITPSYLKRQALFF